MLSWADALQACLAGLMAIFAWHTFGLLMVGVSAGAVVGLLPGVGGAATLAMLLPFIVELTPTQSFALLMGVAAVAATTGDLTSILVGIPGEATTAATVLDGYPMARRGEASRAVGASLASSLAGSCIGALTLAFTIPIALPLARAIGSPELLMLALLGISFIGSVSRGARLKGLTAGALGLLLATVGLDPINASQRYTFGQLVLWDGIGLIPASLGLFAVPEILQLHSRRLASAATPVLNGRLSDGLADVRQHWRLVVQSSVLGSIVGLIPGVGASISQWLAYGFAARRGAGDYAFGDGAVEGVIAPSAANNATLGGSLTPALAFGLPGGLMSGVMIAALILKGLIPGPAMLMPEMQGGHLTLVFSLVWLLVVANVIAVALAWMATDRLVAITSLPANRLVPFLLLLVCIGALLNRGVAADLWIVAAMAAVGLLFERHGWPRAPLLMGLVMGPLAENRLFLSVSAYGASWLTRPGVLAIAAVILAGLFIPIRDPKRAAVRAAGDSDAGPGRIGPSRMLPLAVGALMLLCLAATAGFPPGARLMPRVAAGAALVFALSTLIGGRGPSRSTAGHTSGATLRAPAAWALMFAVLVALLGAAAGGSIALLCYLLTTRTASPAASLLTAAMTGGVLHFGIDRWLRAGLPEGALFAWLNTIHW